MFNTQWINACDNGNITKIEALLNQGQNVNERGPENRTAIMFAGVTGNLQMAKMLIFHGADPFMSDGRGRTARMYAEKMGNNEVADYLKKIENEKNG